MAIFRDRPYGNARFSVEVNDSRLQDVIEVHLPEMAIDLGEIRGGDAIPLSSHKFARRPRLGNLLLKRGFRGSLDWYEWWKQAASGDPDPYRTTIVSLLSEDRSAAVARWKLKDAFPVRYSYSPLDGTDGGIFVEVIEIACQDVEME